MAERTKSLIFRMTTDERATLEELARMRKTTMTRVVTNLIRSADPRQEKSDVQSSKAAHVAYAN